MTPLLRTAFLLALLAAASPAPADAADDWRSDGEAGFLELIAGQSADFDGMQARYQSARVAAPEDWRLAIAHCHFLWRVWDLQEADDLEWVQPVPDLHEACLQGLREQWPGQPEVELFVLDQAWEDADDAAAEALWAHTEDWPAPLRGRLAYRIARSEELKEPRGGYYLEAARLGVAEAVPEAWRHVHAKQGRAGLEALAASAPLATSSYALNDRLRVLLKLDTADLAVAELERHDGLDFSASPTLAARSRLLAGDAAAAAALLPAPAAREARDLRRLRLELALAMDDPEGAARHFRFEADSIGESLQDLVRIGMARPWLLLTPGLLPGSLALLATLLLLALLPAPLLLPAHYRGLARRLAGKPQSPPMPRLGLRMAAYALAVSLVVPLACTAFVAPDRFAMVLDGDVESMDSLFRITLWGTVASLVAMLPLLPWMRGHWSAGVRSELSGLPWVLAAYAGVFTIAFLTAMVQDLLGAGDTSTAQTRSVMTMVEQGLAGYGLGVTILVIGVLVPVFEEWVFRGALLSGLARHLSFGGANLIQAGVFAAIHGDPPRFLFYLSMGLAAGWLVRRRNTLLPAIALHATNNTVAVLLQAG